MGEKLVEQLLDSEWKARRKKRGRESFRYYRYRNMAWSGWALFDRVGADRVCDHKAGMNGWLARIATIVSDRKSGQRGSLGLRQQTSLSTVRLSCRLVPFQLHSCLLHLLVQACRQRPPAWHSHRIFDYLLDSARSCLAPTFFHSNSPRPRNRWSVCHWIAPPSLIPPFAKRANLLNNLRSIFILHYPHRRTHRQYTIFRRGKFIDLLRSRAYPFVSSRLLSRYIDRLRSFFRSTHFQSDHSTLRNDDASENRNDRQSFKSEISFDSRSIDELRLRRGV